MKTSDEKIIERLWRRICRPRGTVFLEFAVVAPLAVMLLCFAFDFSRILRCEQQLEIASRAMCDLETHWAKASFDGNGAAGEKAFPRFQSKKMVKQYLAKAMDFSAPDASGYFYCKAELRDVPGLTSFVSVIMGFLNGRPPSHSHWVIRLLSRILSTALDVFTMKTQRYFSEIIPRDQMLGVSFGAQLPTLLPRKVYDVMGWTSASGTGSRLARVQQSSYRIEPGAGPTGAKVDRSCRVRAYCVMPVLDSAVLPPVTYGRQIKGFIRSYLPEWLQKILF